MRRHQLKRPSLHQRAGASCSPCTQVLRKGLLLGILIVLAGCEPSAFEGALSRYLEGIERTLGQIPAKASEMGPIRPPSATPPVKLALQDDHRLDLLDYLKTTPCALHQLISQRNSSLGQFATDSTRLIYTVQFLQQVDPCIAYLSEENPNLADQLRAASLDKRERLPGLLRSSILSGPEYHAFWKPPQSLGDYPRTLQSDLEVDFKALIADVASLRDGAFKDTADSFNSKLSGLNKGEGGLMLAAWEDVSQSLEIANEMIIAFKAKRPLCYLNRSNPRAENFQGLVRTVFIDSIQPQISALNRRTYALMPLVHQLESDLGAGMAPDFRAFVDQRTQRIEAGRQALRDHVALLGDLFDSCGGIT